MNLKYQLFSLIIIITFLSEFCNASKFNISLSDYESFCDVYKLENRSYGFKDFFDVSSIKNKIEKNNERLHLILYVITRQYANILLSEVDNSRWRNETQNRGCEIIIGAHRNSTSWIRKTSVQYVPSKDSPNTLSEFNPIPIEIIQTNDGELTVNIPGYSEPLLKYSDTHLLNIKFFSFSNFNRRPATWFYNCQFDENSNIEDQKMSENEVKTVETKNTNVNQQLSERPKSTANPTEKNNEEQLLNAKLSAIDPCMIKLKEYFWSGTRPFSRHNSFFDVLVPMLDKFDDNKMLNFHIRVLEVIKELKNTPTTTTKKPVAIDVRFGGSENEVKTVASKNTNVNQQQLSQQSKSTANPTETRSFSKHNSFFDVIVPILDKFDDNKMLDFQLRVLEVIKELKNTPTTTTKKPVVIDKWIDDSEVSS